jgi:hypothetical protein
MSARTRTVRAEKSVTPLAPPISAAELTGATAKPAALARAANPSHSPTGAAPASSRGIGGTGSSTPDVCDIANTWPVVQPTTDLRLVTISSGRADSARVKDRRVPSAVVASRTRRVDGHRIT